MKKLLICALFAGLSLTGCIGINLGQKGEPLPYDMEESKAAFKEKGMTDGFQVEFMVDSESDDADNMQEVHTIGFKEGVIWDDEHAYFMNADNTLYTAVYSEEDYGYVYYRDEGVANGQAAFDAHYDAIASFLFEGYIDEMLYVSKGEVTVANRRCDQFEYSVNMLFVKIKYLVSIDKEYGICMEHTVEASAFSEEGQTGGKAGFRVTDLLFGSSACVPSLVGK